jgi:hypothetical protein
MENKPDQNLSKAEHRKKAYAKEYYEVNKKYYSDYSRMKREEGKKKIRCECGCIVTGNSLYLHRRSHKHKLSMRLRELENELYGTDTMEAGELSDSSHETNTDDEINESSED